MARPKASVTAATSTIGAPPNFGLFGSGLYGSTAELFEQSTGASLVRDMLLMAETDETVGAMLWCINSVMGQVSFTYMPQIDGTDAPDDPEAKKWAELATTMLHDMDAPFADHVEDAMTMIPAGFAPVEMVMKQRNGVDSRYSDNYYGIGALNLLDQGTIWDWRYAGTKIVGMLQMALGVRGRGDGVIPISKVLLYRTTTSYNNPRGRPLLKNAWRVWKLKRKVQDSEAIGIERDLCGLPVFEMPEETINMQFDTDSAGAPTAEALRARAMVAAAKLAVQDMRFNKSGGLVHPSDVFTTDEGGDGKVKKFGIRIMTTAGQRSIDARTAARDYDHAIARVAMMQFLTLGQRSGGSYGLSEDQSSMAVSSIMSLARKVISEWNLKAVPMIWTVNAFPPKYRPRLQHSEVNKNGIAQLGQFMAGIGKAAELWGGDPKMRIALARAGNLPYDVEAQAAAAATFQQTAEAKATAPPSAAANTAKSTSDNQDD